MASTLQHCSELPNTSNYKHKNEVQENSRNGSAMNYHNGQKPSYSYQRSASETPPPPPPLHMHSLSSTTNPQTAENNMNGYHHHQDGDEIHRVTVEDNRSKFAIYSVPNKARKASVLGTKVLPTPDVTPMALSKVMPLLISNGYNYRDAEEASTEHQNGDNPIQLEEDNWVKCDDSLPPQYPNRTAKFSNHPTTKYSSKHSHNNQTNKGLSHLESQPDGSCNVDGDESIVFTSSSVPRRHHKRGRKMTADNGDAAVDSDIEHHLLYGKETTL